VNPFLGLFYHAIGGFASASFYVPSYKVKNWSWETIWITLGFVAWIIMPQIGCWLTVPNAWGIIADCPVKNLIWTYVFGIMWGIGGLTCGLGLRYLGLSLGQSLELGFCASFGTIIPPLFAGNVKVLFTTVSGLTIMGGILLCLAGIAVCGYAGLLKELLLTDEQKKQAVSQKQFAFWKGLFVAVIGGIMSASMAYAFQAGKPIAEAAVAAGTQDVFKNNPVLIIAMAGGFTTNLIAALIMHARNKTFHNFVTIPDGSLLFNYMLAVLAGVLWYSQFFFYGMGTTKMGKYDFTSWSLHMSFIIIGSNLWGVYLKEWKLVNRLTWTLLWIGIIILIIATIVIGWGNKLAAI
jgi:L-rhamnose-H+ transport protein